MDSSFQTTQLKNCLGRIRSGDLHAREELLQKIHDRMERLARKMLRDFPRVRQKEQTLDVLQNALLRLMRSLPETEPDSIREFYGLAALHIRRELKDLARYHSRQGRNAQMQAGALVPAGSEDSTDGFDPPDRRVDSAQLDRWSAFHDAVEELPVQEREVVSLKFYHGWTHMEIAELLQVNERTVRRYWESACVNLYTILNGQVPNLEGQ